MAGQRTTNHAHGSTGELTRLLNDSNGNGNGSGDGGAGDAAKGERGESALRRVVRRAQTHFQARVSTRWADVALLCCYVITGLLDSSSVTAWGSFVSMQTGNTVYLGSGLVAPHESDRWLRALISLACFCVGAYFFSRFHGVLGGRRRGALVASYALQLLLILAAALIVSDSAGSADAPALTARTAVPLALIAFQSAGQTIGSRVLEHSSLTSVVLTSIYADLFADPALFAPRLAGHAERNRRAVAPLLLLLGAALGGLFAHAPGFGGIVGALWLAFALKAAVVIAWCVWSAEAESQSEEA